MQLNIKASADTVRRFIAISDADEWPTGLTIEHAIGALEKSLRAKTDQRDATRQARSRSRRHGWSARRWSAPCHVRIYVSCHA